MQFSIADIQGNKELSIYFNWTANALMPTIPGAADRYLKIHRQTVKQVAQYFLNELNYTPGKLYRGIILRQPAACIMPDKFMQYLSFSTDIEIAKHFANVNGFGSDILNVAEQLGQYGYVIEYTPARSEILFHYELLDVLPYSEAFSISMKMNGQKEVDGLKKQKEIMIAQPAEPLTNIKTFESFKQHSLTY